MAMSGSGGGQWKRSMEFKRLKTGPLKFAVNLKPCCACANRRTKYFRGRKLKESLTYCPQGLPNAKPCVATPLHFLSIKIIIIKIGGKPMKVI